ncbi:unnamed protein product [Aureobasidium vineae]|uniref:GH16 domain-containing protein n=1 Tax=Aureobasidium vineae TaxID=2773715 RepID=A0A9N8JZB6_9PEZI|nr:unnamed protein product [Aureobasidium vineae]
MRSFLYFLAGAGSLIEAVASDSCTCGFYDRSTDQVFTDSIIVYFNETQTIPEDTFQVQTFNNKAERGWNSLYRQGAVAGNSMVSPPSGTQQSLDLFVDPSTNHHVVNGGSVESLRKDILHGSFRASVQGSGPWTGGSALSMMLQFNKTSSMEIDMLNNDNPENARITTLINGEYPSQKYGLNYTILEKGSDNLSAVNPWDFITIRMDWTKNHINFTLAENLTRSIPYKKDAFPTEPMPLGFKHWSTGDSEWMQGPPKNRSVASVAWVRAFFNSSVTTTAQQQQFNTQCNLALACDVDDHTLRTSTNYTSASLKAWKEPPRNEKWKLPSGIVAGSSSFFGLVALLNVLFRRKPWEKLTTKDRKSGEVMQKQDLSTDSDSKIHMPRSISNSTLDSVDASKSKWNYKCTTAEASSSNMTTPWGARTPASGPTSSNDIIDMALLRKKMSEDCATPFGVPLNQNNLRQSPSTGSDGWSSVGHTLVCPTPEVNFSKPIKSPETIRESVEIRVLERKSLESSEKLKEAIVTAHEVPSQSTLVTSPSLPPRTTAPPKRIDYLAGLVAISCIGVTLIHFTLTFIPYAGGLGYGRHYKSELYSRWSATPILLNPIWIGPFFTTSTRFLAQNFLRTGNLADVAKKMLLRAPRMVLPAIVVAALEYFFIELGLTAKLEWLPSITWSTWPWVSNYPNFGWFMNEILELGYLIPNKAPGIVNHYCVGVLWTIPVQLQFSYTTLLGAIMVREIKSHWKRFAFYFWCIAVNWYSMNWGSCFWVGLLIADLNVTYNYVAWLQARPKYLYPTFVLLWVLVIQGPLWTFLEDRGFYTLMTRERNIHPNLTTGAPQGEVASMYPAYFEPRLNTILFAGAVQMMTELSTSFQWFLSLKLWIVLFPHTFTIYLIHGFVFWSFGAWLCVTLASMEILPYWAICLILFVCCYIVIGLAAVCITPFSEGAAMALCRNCWRWASEEPVPHRKTLEPFRKDLFLSRNGGTEKDEEAVVHGVVEVLDEKNFKLDEQQGKGVGESPFDDVNEVSSESSGSRPVSEFVHSSQFVDDAITPVISTQVSTEGLGIYFDEKK